MGMTEVVTFRLSQEDVETLALAAKFRFLEQKATGGPMTAPTVSEYVRYLINQDMTVAVEEIKRRRTV